MRPGQFKEVQRAIDIRFCVESRLLQGRSHSRAGRQMNDAIKGRAVECLLQSGAVAYVRFNQTESRIRKISAKVGALYRRLVEVIEVINDGNLPFAFRQQPIYKMRTDESRAASNKNGLHLSVTGPASLRIQSAVAAALCRRTPYLMPEEQRVASKGYAFSSLPGRYWLPFAAQLRSGRCESVASRL